MKSTTARALVLALGAAAAAAAAPVASAARVATGAALPSPASIVASMDAAAQYYQRSKHATDCGWTVGTCACS
jgi:hypothetical protein